MQLGSLAGRGGLYRRHYSSRSSLCPHLVRPRAAGKSQRPCPTDQRRRLHSRVHVARLDGPSKGESSTESQRDEDLAVQTLVGSIAAGALLGLFGPFDEALPEGAQIVSAALGWSYFTAWTISFYPQILENQRRQSVVGLSPDYLLYSLVGYVCYALYTGALYFNTGIQDAYRIAHSGSAPDVQLSDFLFAAHAVGVTLYTIYQCSTYDRKGQQLSPMAIGTATVVSASILGYTSHISNTCDTSDCASWLPLLFYLGVVKILMTLIKYTPQALLNWQRRSTEGWQINNVLLDSAGGLLSFLQIVWDAAARHDLSVITGNPAKLGISTISIAFDILFIVQHYVFYPPATTTSSSSKEGQQQRVPVPAAVLSKSRADQQ